VACRPCWQCGFIRARRRIDAYATGMAKLQPHLLPFEIPARSASAICSRVIILKAAAPNPDRLWFRRAGYDSRYRGAEPGLR